MDPALDLIQTANGLKYHTVLADPPWRFTNRTGKVAPEHTRLNRYATMDMQSIRSLPVANIVDEPAHLYLWVPNALASEGHRRTTRMGF